MYQCAPWNHPEPIFVDFETQSACDIKETGGRLYASHESTRILLLVWVGSESNAPYNVWIPDHIRTSIPDGYSDRSLWPHQCKHARPVLIHRGREFPAPLIANIKQGHPLVAHNAYGFDRFIWERFHESRPQWLDSLLLARAYGRPGNLDALSKQVLGQGKDAAKKLLKELTTAVRAPAIYSDGYTYRYPETPTGKLVAFLRYGIVDVELMRRLWMEEFENIQVEADVIAANDWINQYGVKVDTELLAGLTELSRYSREQAFNQIFEITSEAGNPLDHKAIRSTQRMHEWIRSYGLEIVDSNGKPCLRKEIVQQYIDSPFVIQEHLTAAKEIPPMVVEVLQLRLSALRITDAKLKRADCRIGDGVRIRDLHSYHVAHTGRFSSSGVQVHNLPRPIRELDIGRLLGEVDWTDRDAQTLFDNVKQRIPERTSEGKRVTVDDVCSALIRPLFIPSEGTVFAITDFAQIEARLVAWVAGEGKLLKAFREGRDPYREFASVMFGVPLEEVNDTQRQVAKSGLLGAGFGIGPDKMRVYAAGMGVDLVKAGVTAEELVETYRNTYTKICGFRPNPTARFRVDGIWQKLDSGVKQVVETGSPATIGMCDWFIERQDLCCRLPSGRVVYYPSARIEDVVPPYVYTLNLPAIPKSTVVYTSPHGPKSLYGGLLFENIIQAMARDILCEAMCLILSKDIPIVLDVHDEVVSEAPKGEAERILRTQVEIMSTPPAWAPDLPLACEGFLAPRFLKKPPKGWLKLSTEDLHK